MIQTHGKMEPLQGTKIVITPPKDDLTCNAKHAFRTICGTPLDTCPEQNSQQVPYQQAHSSAQVYAEGGHTALQGRHRIGGLCTSINAPPNL